jgi:hypothetical protein
MGENAPNTMMTTPSTAYQRTAEMLRQMVRRLRLDLGGRQVLTEAATGPYAVTPVLAALAGAQVTAFAKDSRHGSVAQAQTETLGLAADCGVESQIEVVDRLPDKTIGAADVITNCGHLRPLDAAFIGRMKPGAVMPLMYEAWEFRPGDVDLEACRRRGVAVVGTNERHPALRVFDYLGLLALYGLLQCRVPVAFSKILVISDNPFCPFVVNKLVACQAEVEVLGPTHSIRVPGVEYRPPDSPGMYDAVVVADTPQAEPILGHAGKAKYAVDQIGVFRAVVQIWGDVDRDGMEEVAFCPLSAPPAGHMGVLLSTLGTEPIVRLQAGGLKAAQVVLDASGIPLANESDREFVDAILIPPGGAERSCP